MSVRRITNPVYHQEYLECVAGPMLKDKRLSFQVLKYSSDGYVQELREISRLARELALYYEENSDEGSTTERSVRGGPEH